MRNILDMKLLFKKDEIFIKFQSKKDVIFEKDEIFIEL